MSSRMIALGLGTALIVAASTVHAQEPAGLKAEAAQEPGQGVDDSLVAGYVATLTSAATVLTMNGVLLGLVAAWFLLRSKGVREL